jgi:acetone carboxylase gamma subunit
MMTIWKYQLEMLTNTVLDIPDGYKILCVKKQHDHPVLYVQVRPDKKKVKVEILRVVTGGPIAFNDYIYLGTLMFENDSFVLHYYENRFYNIKLV